MDVKIEPSWGSRLNGEFEAPYFQQLTDFVKQEYRQGTCYPPGNQIFNAFNLCPFNAVKVVIIGQDPYHEPGQAEGLCFSVADGVRFPPSLQNIFKEIERPRAPPALQRQSASMGGTGRAIAQRHPHRACPSGGIACRTRMGDFHRRRHPRLGRGTRAPGVYALGQLCAKEGGFHQPLAPSRPLLGPPLAPLGLSRFLRQPPFLPRQRFSGAARGNANCLVNNGERIS